MADWFDKITGRKRSANEAKERLKLVLIHDRTDISPATLEQLKDDLLKTISSHIKIDTSRVKITMLHEGREQRLIADIPLKNINL
ncbi:cell division topological specificity factor MinE [bacterium]|nr:cell division topological specificity factor MinE [bacterium]